MRLSTKLALTFLLGASVPIVLAIWFTQRRAREEVRNLALRRAQTLVERTAERLSGTFAARMAEIRAYAEQPGLKSRTGPSPLPCLRELLARNREVYEKFLLVLPDGRYYSTARGNRAQGDLATTNDRDPRARPLDIRDRDYWQHCLGSNPGSEDRATVSRPVISKTSGVPQVVVAATIRGADGQVVGLLGGAIRMSSLQQQVEELRRTLLAELGPGARAFLVSADGSYVVHWDPSKLIGQAGIHDTSLLKEGSAHLKRAADPMLKGLSGHVGYQESGERWALLYAPVGTARYALAVDVPCRMAWRRLGPETIGFLIALTLSLVATPLVAVGLARRYTRPLLDLEAAAKRVAHGDFSLIATNGGEEIQHLTSAFNTMAAEVAHRESELQTSYRRLGDNILELERLRKAAEASSLAKSRFLATVSHELHTPLNTIQLYGEFLRCQAQESGDPGQLADLARIQGAATHLGNLVDDLLAYSDLDTGRARLQLTAFSLQDLLQVLVPPHRERALAKGLLFEVRTGPGLPDPAWGDPRALRQACAHLLDNAIKYTNASGSVRFEIEAAGRNEAEQILVRFRVQDTGIGIPETEIPRIFAPFTQADESSTRSYGGTGLGLAICIRLARLMEGDLRVESIPEEGSTFVLTVPLSSGEASPNEGASPVGDSVEGASPAPGRLQGEEVP